MLPASEAELIHGIINAASALRSGLLPSLQLEQLPDVLQRHLDHHPCRQVRHRPLEEARQPPSNWHPVPHIARKEENRRPIERHVLVPTLKQDLQWAEAYRKDAVVGQPFIVGDNHDFEPESAQFFDGDADGKDLRVLGKGQSVAWDDFISS